MDNSLNMKDHIIKNREHQDHRYGERWPKFFAVIFEPSSLNSVVSGGQIGASENPAKALRMDFELLADLFQFVEAEEKLSSFWSSKHRAWVFFTREEIRTLGFGSRALCNFALKPLRHRDKFYEEVLDHSCRQS